MKSIENYNIPEGREERIEKLNKAIQILKDEFVGLDNIIDDIKQSISPWYITPEIIKRPVVISLWGMTGTGKTSLIKRLIDLLGLTGKTIFFDCGLESNDSSSSNVSDKISDVLCSDDEESKDENKSKDMVFVFDEFQYARTINEDGCEEAKSSLRPIWNIIDDGVLNINSFQYGVSYFKDFIEDFDAFVTESKFNYDIKVVNKKVTDLKSKKILKDELGLLYFNDCYGVESDESKNDDDSPLIVFNDRVIRTILRKLNSFKPKMGTEFIRRLSKEERSLGDWITEMKNLSNMITAPKVIDCSRSLVFILGNLDEAFTVEGEINPDFEADVFYDITSKVTISDIKEALKRRFRAEQIARFGNNLIKYPTLKRDHFTKIIKKELDSIFTDFKNKDGIEIEYGEDIIELVYSESVYPVQGVRPVFTTIGFMITPLLSDIILESEESKKVKIELKDQSIWKDYKFKVPEVILLLKYESGKITEKTIKLQLGELRNPLKRKTRHINSVHEAGHAILFAYCKGIAPINIVSVSTDRGGFCSTYDSEKDKEIESREDIQKEVMISLAGYEAEKLVYKNDDKCLLGSTSDIESAWKTLSYCVYKSGYFEPYSFSNRETEIGCEVPSGFPDTISVVTSKEFGNVSPSIQSRIIDEFASLRTKTINVLNTEKKLLKELALYLGEKGSMNSEIFLEFVDKYGNKLTINYMKKISEEDKNFYFDHLNNLTVD